MSVETKTTPSAIQEALNKKLWSACDTFRGAVSSTQYQNYILAFLFLKYISDVHEEAIDRLRAQYGDDIERIKRRLERERFVFPDHCTFRHVFENRGKDNVGEIINQALRGIAQANPKKLGGVFGDIDFNSESILGRPAEKNARLRDLIGLFKDIDLRPSIVGSEDIVGNSYEYLIARFAEDAGQKGGEFYTPAGVAELLAEIVEPADGDTIYDPTCGSGSLLIRTAHQVKSKNYSIYGQESNASTWALCKMNMFLHGIDNATIERGDTIRGPIFLEGTAVRKFHKLVANPPFSLDKWGHDEASADPYKRFKKWGALPPKSKGDYAFIIHMVESLLEGGTAAVVVPHGVLFRGASEGRLREGLIKQNLIHAVVGLPPNLFYGTGIAAAIIVFKKGRKEKDILFIDASHEFEPGKRQNRLRIDGAESDVMRIIDCYRSRKAMEKYSALIQPQEIEENEFNLNISRYIQTFSEEAQVDIDAVQAEILSLESELARTREEMGRFLKELGYA